MVSAMAATTASVSPSRQDTRTENATPTTIAMMARRHQTRILGLAARRATLPRRSPMPGRGGSPPAGSTGVTTSFHGALGGSAGPGPVPSSPPPEETSPRSSGSPASREPPSGGGGGAARAPPPSPGATGPGTTGPGTTGPGPESGGGSAAGPPAARSGAGAWGRAPPAGPPLWLTTRP